MRKLFGRLHPLVMLIAFAALVQPLSGGTSPVEVKVFSDLKVKADAGDPVAQFKVGQAYFDGSGVAEDVIEGAKWYRKSAEQGNVDAQWNLANAYDFSKDSRLSGRLRLGVYECYTQALRWWLMAAEQGHAPSQYSYADKLYNDIRVTAFKGTDAFLFPEEERPKYMALALKWSLKAAEQGNPDAQYLHGLIHDEGYALGGRRIEEAFAWYSLAAEGGKKWAKEKVDSMELQLDSSIIGRAKARASSLKAEIESKKAGK